MGFGAVLGLLATGSCTIWNVALVIGITFLVTAVVTAVISRGRHLVLAGVSVHRRGGDLCLVHLKAVVITVAGREF